MAVTVVTLEVGCFGDVQRPAGLLSAPASAVSPPWVVTVRVTKWLDMPGQWHFISESWCLNSLS